MITISARALGSRRPLAPDWAIPVPPEFTDGWEPMTLRRLITAVVCAEVEAFRLRQRDRRLVRVLTEKEIRDGALAGKVDMGGRDPGPAPDPEEAVAAALQAFLDGLYLVLLDGEEQRDLDREVYVADGCTMTFIRLTMLAGG